MWKKWYWRRVLLRVLRFPPVRIIPPVLYRHIHLIFVLTGRTKRAKPEAIPKTNAFRKSGSSGKKALCLSGVKKATDDVQRDNSTQTLLRRS